MKAPDIAFKPKGLYIGGQWVAPVKEKTFETINPSNGDHLADVPLS